MAKDISYFDHACEKHGFQRDYLQYLHPANIYVVLQLCNPDLTKKQVIDEINKTQPYREYTPSRLDKKIMDIRCILHKIHQHAVLFGITKTIKPFSISQLERIIEEHREKEQADA